MVIEPTEDSLKQHLLCGVWYCHTYQKVHSGRVDVMIDADSFVLIVQVYTRHGVIVAFLILSVHDKTFDRISEWSSMDKRCDGGGTVISVRSGPKKPGNGQKKLHHRVKISPLREGLRIVWGCREPLWPPSSSSRAQPGTWTGWRRTVGEVTKWTRDGVSMVSMDSLLVLQTISTWGREQGRRTEAESVSCCWS